MNKWIILLLFFFNVLQHTAQPVPFQKSFGDSLKSEYGISVIQLSSGSIFFAGYNYNSIGTTDVTLTKLDMNGNITWQQAYHDSLRGLFSNKMIFYNNTFYIAGQCTDQNSNTDALILHIDTLGNLLFQKNYGGNTTSESFNWIEPDLNYGFMCNGYATASTGTGNDIYVARLDLNCDVIWENNYGSVYNDVSMAIRRTGSGDFVLSGDKLIFPAPNYNAYVLKIDTSGNPLWDVDVVSLYNSGCRSIMVNHNGDYIVVGESATPTSSYFDVLLCKITQGGSLEWSKTIPASDKGDAGFSIIEPAPDHYLITGYGFNVADSSSDVILIHADSGGNQVSKRYYDHSQIDFGYEINPSVFGGYLISGTNYDSDNQYYLIYDTISLVTSAGELFPENDFYIYSNPVDESGIIYFNREIGNFFVSIFDLSGAMIFYDRINSQIKKYQIKKRFSPGMYLLKINTEKINYNQKLVFR
ncbi:MAG: T9SS type A sorting domain-containing protein [Bacteroidia bacterium]